MDIDTDSSDETSGDDYTTESSDDDDGMETAEIEGVKIQLPQGMCEKKDIFQSILSMETWNTLSENDREHLTKFLPTFPENDEEEKTETLKRLFEGDNFRFNNPLDKFHQDLKAGYFRPDIANIRRIIKKAEKKEALYRYKKYRQRLKYDVIESQRKLLEQVNNLPPGVEPKIERTNHQQELESNNYVIHRTKRRYFQILNSIHQKSTDENLNNNHQSSNSNNYNSPDENYPEGPPLPLSRKQRRHLNSIRNSQNNELYISTMSLKSTIDLEKYITPTYNPFYITDDAYKSLIIQHKRRKLEKCDDPEYNTKGITISDVVNRTQLPYLKTIPVNIKNHDNNRISSCSSSGAITTNTQSITNSSNSSSSKKRIKSSKSHHHHHHHHHHHNHHNNNHNNNLGSGGGGGGGGSGAGGHSSNSDIAPGDSDSDFFELPNHKPTKLIPNHKSSHNKNRSSKSPKNDKKDREQHQQQQQQQQQQQSLKKDNNSDKHIVNTATISNNFEQFNKVPDLENIDMMSLPIDLDNTDIDIIEFPNNKPELMQETHANFLSLIRDIICSTAEHRMSFNLLEERLKSWQENPISPLNDWYSLNDNWVKLLKSAVNFLCGNSSDQPDGFVPYMEYKLKLDMFQWIGAGRDSDNLLAPLCQYWLEHRNNDVKPTASILKEKIDKVDVEVVSDRSITPPPPRYPTNWTVRKATPDEIKEFRQQEKLRYDNPHKAFTYRCNGYESVVGPLKGIYNPAVGNTKARGHTMLNADRPNFVTILSLVRDATARLPNGEGTRADICELLKSSQYISSTAPENVLQSVVSGALDRMHTQFDPCVKYDPKRKIWIYLHRNRTEEDFERIHQQYQGVNKSQKKSSSRKSTITTTTTNTTTTTTTATSSSSSSSSSSANRSKVNKESKPNKSKELHDKNKKLKLSNDNSNNKIEESPSSVVNKSTIIVTTAPIIKTSNSSSVATSAASKNLVKILSPNHSKSLIIPTSQVIKPDQTQQRNTIKLNQPLVAQQLIQTMAAAAANSKQKPIQIVKTISDDKQENKTTQQFIQSISPQQLQNIKNVTLVRNLGQVPVTSSTSTSGQDQPQPQQIQIKTQATLTPAQQHQIIQTIKQRILPQAQIINPQQQQQQQQHQQILLKQKAVKQQTAGTSLLGQSKITEVKSGLTANQTPVVAKVLTNAAGQVISVESLLAHQKQHGSLPHGTTLRVSGAKGNPTNIIQLTGSGGTKQQTAQIAQFAVGSQNNIIALTTNNQPKLVVAAASPTSSATGQQQQQQQSVSTSIATTAVKQLSRGAVTNLNKGQTLTAKFTPKITQQLINAKLITTQNLADGQKIQVQPKIFVGQQNQQVKLNTSGKGGLAALTKPVTLSLASAGGNTLNTIRMVNATNLNLTHIGGKPILLASKGTALQNLQGQNVILQSATQSATAASQSPSGNVIIQQQNIVKANTTAVVTTTTTTTTTTTSNTASASSVATATTTTATVFGQPLKVQTTPTQQIVFSSAGVKTTNTVQGQQQQQQQQQIVLEGHPVRLQTGTTGTQNTQRVVLASPGQGGQIVAQQILLPAGFQGTAINIKALQGVKVIPLAQAQGRGARQLYARVMSPTIVKAASTTATPPTSTHTTVVQEKLPESTITTSE